MLRWVLKSKARNPFPTSYKPKINVTDELDQTLASRFMQLIGILRWAVEIGCIDIYLATSLLSQYQANPRFGHLEAAYHIFAYLKNHQDMGDDLLLILTHPISMNLFSIKAPIGRTFMAMLLKNCHPTCPNCGDIGNYFCFCRC
jgi:hypothetical protein